jgi:hypothetical protein
MESARLCGVGGGALRVGWAGRMTGRSFYDGADDGIFPGRKAYRTRGLFLLRRLRWGSRIGGCNWRIVMVGGWLDQRSCMVRACVVSLCGFLLGDAKRWVKGERS